MFKFLDRDIAVQFKEQNEIYQKDLEWLVGHVLREINHTWLVNKFNKKNKPEKINNIDGIQQQCHQPTPIQQ